MLLSHQSSFVPPYTAVVGIKLTPQGTYIQDAQPTEPQLPRGMTNKLRPESLAFQIKTKIGIKRPGLAEIKKETF